MSEILRVFEFCVGLGLGAIVITVCLIISSTLFLFFWGIVKPLENEPELPPQLDIDGTKVIPINKNAEILLGVKK